MDSNSRQCFQNTNCGCIVRRCSTLMVENVLRTRELECTGQWTSAKMAKRSARRMANGLFKSIVWSMYGRRCVLCGKNATQIHHIDPKGMGGGGINRSFNPLNGVPLCGECHHAIHSIHGERTGKAMILAALRREDEFLWETHPLKARTMKEAADELSVVVKALGLAYMDRCTRP